MPKLDPRVGLLRIDPLVYSFISGVFVSIAANLFTGLFGGDFVPARAGQILFASTLALVASCSWMYAGYCFGVSAKAVEREVKLLQKSRLDAELAVIADGMPAVYAVLVALAFSIASMVLLIPASGVASASSTQEGAASWTAPGSSATSQVASAPAKVRNPEVVTAGSASEAASQTIGNKQ